MRHDRNALTARYSREQVTKNGFASEEFVASTFHQEGEYLEVKPGIRERSPFTSAMF